MQMMWLVVQNQEYEFFWLLVRYFYLAGREWYLKTIHTAVELHISIKPCS